MAWAAYLILSLSLLWLLYHKIYVPFSPFKQREEITACDVQRRDYGRPSTARGTTLPRQETGAVGDAGRMASGVCAPLDYAHVPDNDERGAADTFSPPKPSISSKSNATQLMPPPPRPAPNAGPARLNGSEASNVQSSSKGPLPSHPAVSPSSARPNNTRPSSLLIPASSSTLAPSARPRKKVILKPGHSPLDWAALTMRTTTQELSGVPYPQRITPLQLANNTGRKGKPAWSSYKGKVYNIGPYLPFHPGGEGELMRAAGKDGTKLFEEVHPWINWENMMNTCLVGFLISDGDGLGLDEQD